MSPMLVAVLKPLLPKCSTDDECVVQFGKHSGCRDYWCECIDGAEYQAAYSKKCLLSRTGTPYTGTPPSWT